MAVLVLMPSPIWLRCGDMLFAELEENPADVAGKYTIPVRSGEPVEFDPLP